MWPEFEPKSGSTIVAYLDYLNTKTLKHSVLRRSGNRNNFTWGPVRGRTGSQGVGGEFHVNDVWRGGIGRASAFGDAPFYHVSLGLIGV